MVSAGGRRLLGADHSGVALATAQAKYPHVPTEKHSLQDLPYQGEFDGVMCVDAMEFGFTGRLALGVGSLSARSDSGGWLYLTVELGPEDRVSEVNREARKLRFPVVDGEWVEPDGFYHHYPSMDAVRAWVGEAEFVIYEEAEGPWHEEEYSYHHVLAHL